MAASEGRHGVDGSASKATLECCVFADVDWTKPSSSYVHLSELLENFWADSQSMKQKVW